LNVERNQLNANYTAGSGTLTFKYPLGGVTQGARLSSGLNTFYVWATNPSGLTATVTGGDQGSTDANLSTGATVYVRPIITDFEVWTALGDELTALSAAGLARVETFDFTYSSSIDGYDLTGITDLERIYEVRYQEPGPYKDWPRLPAYEWRLDRNALATDFASGNAIKVMRGGWPGYDIRVVYMGPFATFSNLTDDVTTVSGVDAAWTDLLTLGAAIRLWSGREIKRNLTESQPDTRRAEEVPAGAVSNAPRGLMLKYQQRLSDELARFRRKYPYVQAM
jgi:hypothetical protein